jgi:hypothetical protein
MAVRGARRRLHHGGHPAVVFSVKPAKVFAHAKGDPFGATTHKF